MRRRDRAKVLGLVVAAVAVGVAVGVADPVGALAQEPATATEGQATTSATTTTAAPATTAATTPPPSTTPSTPPPAEPPTVPPPPPPTTTAPAPPPPPPATAASPAATPAPAPAATSPEPQLETETTLEPSDTSRADDDSSSTRRDCPWSSSSPWRKRSARFVPSCRNDERERSSSARERARKRRAREREKDEEKQASERSASPRGSAPAGTAAALRPAAGVSPDGFGVPPFLLPIYQAAGMQYGIRWEILAAINEIETDYGRNLNVSSAGALGWMQFMPATWRGHGVDANRDGLRDPYNPIDAIFAAARYLKAADAERDLRGALFAYNHANWYVDDVLRRAGKLAGMPAGLIGSLTWLAQGQFPILAPARVDRARSAAVARGGRAAARGLPIVSRPRAAVIAVNDLRIVGVGRTERLGRYVRARDAQGNTYTYAGLGTVARFYPAPRPRGMTRATARALRRDRGAAWFGDDTAAGPSLVGGMLPERLSARASRAPSRTVGGERYAASAADARRLGLNPRDTVPRRLRKGSRVVAGTILGRLGQGTAGRKPRLRFVIRPSANGALPIDPRPIIAGWRLLERTAPGSAAWRGPLVAPKGRWRSIGQILLMRKAAVVRRVLGDGRVRLYDCGRRDVRAGRIDRRVLATLEYLASAGLKPTVTSLRCGHSRLTAGGRVSFHASGNAVDISAINGVPILGHQGAGSITDAAIRRLLTLQGAMRPAEIISLMSYGPDAPNAFAMGDHADHIHVGFRPYGPAGADSLGPKGWVRFARRLGQIRNPTVRVAPSGSALRDRARRPARAADRAGRSG